MPDLFNRLAVLTIMALLPVLAAAPASGEVNVPVAIATFATPVSDQEPSVRQNILIAARKLDGVTVQPGGTISFNDTVGEGSAANGFQPGRVLYQDRTAMEPGGGLCQASSTLFNVLLMSGFVIVERHRHFQPVTYVPAGLDATIRWGKKDLRMRNPHPFPVTIRCVCGDRTLSMTVLGPSAPEISYDVETVEEEVEIPFSDPSAVRPGLSVEVYLRRTGRDGRFERELLYRDFYPPVSMEK